MNRLIEKIVFCGLVTAWRLATWPTSRSPSFVNADDRRSRPAALGVGNHDRIAALHDRDDGVRGAQVDPDDLLSHDPVLLIVVRVMRTRTPAVA